MVAPMNIRIGQRVNAIVFSSIIIIASNGVADDPPIAAIEYPKAIKAFHDATIIPPIKAKVLPQPLSLQSTTPPIKIME